MSRLHQITEEDLATLEREIPAVFDQIYDKMNPRMRGKFRIIQRIIMDVRWNYGPPTEVEQIETDDPRINPEEPTT